MIKRNYITVALLENNSLLKFYIEKYKSLCFQYFYIDIATENA